MKEKSDADVVASASTPTPDPTAAGSLMDGITVVRTTHSKHSNQPNTLYQNKIPRFGKADYLAENVEKRRSWLAGVTNTKLPHISGNPIHTQKWAGNIENLLGVVQVPVGITGPLQINGQYANGNFYVPMATTEGAIVTTYNIGMRIISNSGGANVHVIDNGAHISPMFRVTGLRDGLQFQDWVSANFENIRNVAESTTKRGKLIKIKQHYWDRRVVLQFIYNTADAQGMNMINVATEKACQLIHSETGKTFNVRSNYSAVKKVSLHATYPTFGKSVRAEVTIPAVELSKLNVTPRQVMESWLDGISVNQKCGMIGVNCQAANGIAAIFLACGQDIADITSSHIVHANFIANEDSLYAEVYIPSLMIGTVGGGTGQGTQKECLEILGCYGSGKVLKFAEIIGAAVLAGEITTVSAVINGSFVSAHAKLGRNRPNEPV